METEDHSLAAAGRVFAWMFVVAVAICIVFDLHSIAVSLYELKTGPCVCAKQDKPAEAKTMR